MGKTHMPFKKRYLISITVPMLPLIDHAYPGGVHSCCSSWGNSWYTASPPPPLDMDTVRSTYHTHPQALYRGCHTHRVDSPGNYAVPRCGNPDDKRHTDGLQHVAKKETNRVMLHCYTTGHQFYFVTLEKESDHKRGR